ncbi:hypothetical protein AT436_000876 [Escherichia coli]
MAGELMALSSTQVAPDLLMGLLIRYYVFLNFRRRSREGLARLWLAGRKRRHVHALLFFA